MQCREYKDINPSAQKAPWLSVIIPIYNAEKYLHKCIRSILTQKFSYFELILVNDGSLDRSADICKSIAAEDSRVRYFEKENGGSFQSRLFGAEHAKGSYFTFCDADDYYASVNSFQIMHKAISEQPCSFLQFGHIRKYNHLYKCVHGVKQNESACRTDFFSRDYPNLLCNGWKDCRLRGSVWNKVYHRSLLSKLPASASAERIFWGDDVITNLYLLSTCDSALYIPDCLYTYQLNTGGTKAFSRSMMQDLDKIKQYQTRFLVQQEHVDKVKIRNSQYSEIASWFYLYLIDAAQHLDEESLRTLIAESLQLSSFRAARQYYLEESKETWEAVELLRKGDVDAYINCVKSSPRRASRLRELKDFLIKKL